MVDWSERTTCVLFGDGAGAVVLKADTETGILSTHLHADGGKKELLWNPVGVSVGFKENEKNAGVRIRMAGRSEEHTSELQSLMRLSYAVFCLKKKNTHNYTLRRRTYANI